MKINKIIYKLKMIPPVQKVIAAVFFLSLFWVVASSAYSMVHQHMIETTTVGAQYTDVVYRNYGFIQAKESLITVEQSGDATVSVEESKRVSKNHEVFTVKTKDDRGKTHNKHYYATISGIVSYHIDGYEKITNINRIKKLDFRSLYEENLNSKEKGSHSKEAVAGMPYAKIIDNLKDTYLYMSYDPKENVIFKEEGDVFRIRFPELGESTTGTVKEIIDDDNGKKFCKISLGPVSESFLLNRVVQAELYQIETATLELPKDALVYDNDKAGVYIVSNGAVQWSPVKIIKESKNTVRCKTLDEGTIVVLTPQRVSPGDIVKGS